MQSDYYIVLQLDFQNQPELPVIRNAAIGLQNAI